MGRNNRAQERPQAQRLIRSRLAPDRELNAALSQPRQKAFGIRRRIKPECETTILTVLNGLQKDEDIPEKVKLRDRLHVTLLSSRTVGRQMMRGLVAGYELGKKSNLVRDHAITNGYLGALSVTRGDVRVYQGYSVYLAVESVEISEEISEIHNILGVHGVKGFMKDANKLGLHISLGAAKQSDRMTKTEQRHVQHVVEDRFAELPLPVDIPLLGWEVYP